MKKYDKFGSVAPFRFRGIGEKTRRGLAKRPPHQGKGEKKNQSISRLKEIIFEA